ncbi:uncharacterized protein [Aegilops tauschii subsp. strangulata]|uniref:uncharacterized protein n=1 Tax=Aegilops tauschii subsp. strangulata TaxID=200361 RepID=UPI001ABC9DAD|nr:uncharacterized protein LOC109747685 [Aegilops tauschii subsp. strangulata]
MRAGSLPSPRRRTPSQRVPTAFLPRAGGLPPIACQRPPFPAPAASLPKHAGTSVPRAGGGQLPSERVAHFPPMDVHNSWRYLLVSWFPSASSPQPDKSSSGTSDGPTHSLELSRVLPRTAGLVYLLQYAQVAASSAVRSQPLPPSDRSLFLLHVATSCCCRPCPIPYSRVVANEEVTNC